MISVAEQYNVSKQLQFNPSIHYELAPYVPREIEVELTIALKPPLLDEITVRCRSSTARKDLMLLPRARSLAAASCCPMATLMLLPKEQLIETFLHPLLIDLRRQLYHLKNASRTAMQPSIKTPWPSSCVSEAGVYIGALGDPLPLGVPVPSVRLNPLFGDDEWFLRLPAAHRAQDCKFYQPHRCPHHGGGVFIYRAHLTYDKVQEQLKVRLSMYRLAPGDEIPRYVGAHVAEIVS